MRTRSKTKRTRENLNRLPREVEATLPSWVKCTDPIPREILEEVRKVAGSLQWAYAIRHCSVLSERRSHTRSLPPSHSTPSP